ncbi:MAG TPA: hypothetical protein VEP90_15935, partial [Methylomirabilota bacterium]|nr:hypothetical protein [Methylomirabilota bacterium]
MSHHPQCFSQNFPNDKPGSWTVGTLTQITPRAWQQVLRGVKHCRQSCRSLQDTKLWKGAQIGPRCIELALIKPHAGVMALGRATL